MSFLVELIQFIVHRKKLILLPLILAMLFFGGLMVVGQGSAVAPFIYAIF